MIVGVAWTKKNKLYSKIYKESSVRFGKMDKHIFKSNGAVSDTSTSFAESGENLDWKLYNSFSKIKNEKQITFAFLIIREH